MRACCIPILLLVVAAAPRPAHAQSEGASQHLFARRGLSVSLFGGGIAFSDFRREVDSSGFEDPLERRLSASTSVLGAAALTYWLGGRWGVRLHASYSPSRFEVRSPETFSTLQARSDDTVPALSRLDVWMYDADVLFRIPLPLGRVEPYGVLGGGAVEYRLRTAEDETVPEAVAIAFDGDRQRALAAVVGVGAVVPLERYRLMLNFELASHIARTPINENALPTVAFDPESEARVDEVGYTSHVRLMIGLTVPLFWP